MKHSEIQNRAVALQVFECGCSHCQYLMQKAFGHPDEIADFKKRMKKVSEM